MNVDCFLKRFPEILFGLQNDSTFETINFLVGGTTSHKIGKLLNFAVSQMSGEECYVETGVFQGASLISANYRNGRKAFGIDPYIGMAERADPIPVRDKARQYIAGLGDGAVLIEKDFRHVSQEELGSPVGVSFIDAMHTYQDVIQNLEWLEPKLADNALVFFDDINYEGVQNAVFDWFSTHRENYELTFLAKPFYRDGNYLWTLGDRFLNNGLAILRYHKDSAMKATFSPVKLNP
jgi:predicted O-methyltransferase YrrM